MPDAHAPSTLAAMRDRYRVLLVFAADAKDAQLERQMRELRADPAGFNERDLLLVPVLEHGGSGAEAGELPTATLAPDEATAALRKYDPEGGFAVVLLGKDGGQKLHRRNILERESLYDSIDRMPMRQQEMRGRHH